MFLSSNTILKNDQPFVEKVLRNAIDLVDEMIITVSCKSTDGTREIVEHLEREYPTKIVLSYEDVQDVKQLTWIRQIQLDQSKGDWIWFLDGDDLWNPDTVNEIKKHFEDDIDAMAIDAIQLISLEHHDFNWWNKSFTKFFKKQNGVHYEGDWPRDLIYKGSEHLYWKENKERVPRMSQFKFYHLALLKAYSFRQEHVAYKYTNIVPTKLPEEDITWLSSQNIKGL